MTLFGFVRQWGSKETSWEGVSTQMQCSNSYRVAKSADKVEIDHRMSVIKPLHSQWLVNINTYFTSAHQGQKVIWKRQELVDS